MRCRRTFKRILLFLLLGAIVNIAVAWSLSSIEVQEWSHRGGQYPAPDRYVRWWQARAPKDFPSYPRIVYRFAMLGREDLRMDQGGEPTSLAHFCCYAIRAGLPLTSLEGVQWIDNRPVYEGSQPILHQRKFVVFAGGLSGGGRGLPMCPIWPGFAINTIFYAVILWVLFAFPFALRRWRRIKRGLCARCGYPLGTSAVCSECGTPIAVHGAAAPCNPREQT